MTSMNETNIKSLIDKWNETLQTGSPESVITCYDDNAILLPTLSNQVRHNHDEIKDYFVHFLAKKPWFRGSLISLLKGQKGFGFKAFGRSRPKNNE